MCTLAPKKDGSPNIEFFNSAESLQGFETIRQWLQKNSKKVRQPTTKRPKKHPVHMNKNGAC